MMIAFLCRFLCNPVVSIFKSTFPLPPAGIVRSNRTSVQPQSVFTLFISTGALPLFKTVKLCSKSVPSRTSLKSNSLSGMIRSGVFMISLASITLVVKIVNNSIEVLMMCVDLFILFIECKSSLKFYPGSFACLLGGLEKICLFKSEHICKDIVWK